MVRFPVQVWKVALSSQPNGLGFCFAALAVNVSRVCPTFNTPLVNGVFYLLQNVLLAEWKLYRALWYTEVGSKGESPFGRSRC